LPRILNESQDYSRNTVRSQIMYDYNLVTMAEQTVVLNQDQVDLVKNKIKPTWNQAQEENLAYFKSRVENMIFHGERHIEHNTEEVGAPRRSMRGFFEAVQTHVSYYNPYSTVDYKRIMDEFLLYQGFRNNPKGMTKVITGGTPAIHAFHNAYRDFLRIDSQDMKKLDLGFDIKTYSIMGRTVKVVENDSVFRLGSPMEWWLAVLDPTQCQLKIKQDYSSKYWQNPDERKIKIGYTWQGTVAWHNETANAILRTV
jgi:hypothetical protein